MRRPRPRPCQCMVEQAADRRSEILLGRARLLVLGGLETAAPRRKVPPMEDATQHGGQETTLLLRNQGWLMGMVFVVVGTVRKRQEFQKLGNQDQDKLRPREHSNSRKFEVRAAPLVGGRADILFDVQSFRGLRGGQKNATRLTSRRNTALAGSPTYASIFCRSAPVSWSASQALTTGRKD